MNIFKLKLNDTTKSKILSQHLNPFILKEDIITELQICMVYEGCRPIFIKNKLYNNMDELLIFISKNSSILNIYKDDKKINHADFIKHIVDLTVNAIDLDKMKDIKELNNIYQELYKDNIGTIWLNKN